MDKTLEDIRAQEDTEWSDLESVADKAYVKMEGFPLAATLIGKFIDETSTELSRLRVHRKGSSIMCP